MNLFQDRLRKVNAQFLTFADFHPVVSYARHSARSHAFSPSLQLTATCFAISCLFPIQMQRNRQALQYPFCCLNLARLARRTPRYVPSQHGMHTAQQPVLLCTHFSCTACCVTCLVAQSLPYSCCIQVLNLIASLSLNLTPNRLACFSISISISNCQSRCRCRSLRLRLRLSWTHAQLLHAGLMQVLSLILSQ